MSSNNYPGEEEATNQLYETIKAKFEQNGVFQEMRCLLQSKMIAMMHGKHQSTNSWLHKTHQATAEGDARLKLVHQLIMEYFMWHGFHYSAEMFSIESSCNSEPTMRQYLEGVLGKFPDKDMPILLQMVANAWEHKENNK